MRLARIGLAYVCIASGMAIGVLAAEGSAQGWQTDFAQAEAEAKRTGKTLLVHFYADWCGPCREMERAVLGQADVKAHLGTSVIGVKVNSDHRRDLVARFSIQALPSDVFVSPDGNVIDRTVGSTNRSAYLAKLTRHGSPDDGPMPTEDPLVIAAAEKPGLAGYCPVSIVANKSWRKGQPKFVHVHDGIEYRLADEAELALFIADPAKYVPKKLGCDVVALAKDGEAVPGNVRFGAYYRDEFYLFATEDNRQQFLATPSRFAGVTRVVQIGDVSMEMEVMLGR